MDVQPLSVKELKDTSVKTGEVWIINNTDLNGQRNRGQFHLAVLDEQGVMTAISLPNTWIPIDLQNYCNPADLFKSNNFISSLRKQVIVGISPDAAKEIMNSPHAREEARKIEQRNGEVGNLSGGSLSISTESSGMAAELPDANAIPGLETAINESDRAIMSIVSQLNDGVLQSEAAIEQMEAINPPPSQDAYKDAASIIGVTSSSFYKALSAKIGSPDDYTSHTISGVVPAGAATQMNNAPPGAPNKLFRVGPTT